jgi:hypothetical protein
MVEKCLCARCPERRAQDLSELKTCPSARHVRAQGMSELAPNGTPCHEGDGEHENRVWTKVKTNEENKTCPPLARSGAWGHGTHQCA